MKAFCFTPFPASPDSSSEHPAMAAYTLCDTAVVPDHNPLFVPDFDTRFDLWPAIAIRIGRLGKSIAPRFACRYVDAMGGGVVVQAHDLLRGLSASGRPWMEAVSFDNAAPHGAWTPADLQACSSVTLRYAVTPLSEPAPETPPADADTYTLPLDLAQVISDLSRLHTLRNGDLIYIAFTPRPVEAVPDSRMTVWLGDIRASSIRIK